MNLKRTFIQICSFPWLYRPSAHLFLVIQQLHCFGSDVYGYSRLKIHLLNTIAGESRGAFLPEIPQELMEAQDGANSEEWILDFLDVYVCRGWYINVKVNTKVAKKSINVGFNWLLVYVPLHILPCTAAFQQHHIGHFIIELIFYKSSAAIKEVGTFSMCLTWNTEGKPCSSLLVCLLMQNKSEGLSTHNQNWKDKRMTTKYLKIFLLQG